MVARIVAVCLALAVAGCVGPSQPSGPEAAFASVVGASLVHVSGEAGIPHPPSEALVRPETWEFGYYRAETDTAIVVDVRDGRATVREHEASPGLADAWAPISPDLQMGSVAAAQAAVAAMGGSLPALAPGDRLSYWLTHRDGRDVWQIVHRPANGTATAILVDAASKQVVAEGAGEDLGFHEAVRLAAPSVRGALLIEAQAMEAGQGGFLAPRPAHHAVGQVRVPPDRHHADGKAGLWILLYRDLAGKATFPVAVHVGQPPVHGKPLDVVWDNAWYQAGDLDAGALVELSRATEHLSEGGTIRTPPLEYQLGQGALGPVWHISIRSTGFTWAYNAESGERIGCSACA